MLAYQMINKYWGRQKVWSVW